MSRCYRLLFIFSAIGLLFWILFPISFKKAILPKQPNILFITMDTTIYRHLSCYGYTKNKTVHMDRLAQEGVLFENSFTPVSLTQPTHSTLFTGVHPIHHGVRYNLLFRLPDEYETLAEILQKEGYHTAAIVGAYVLEKRFNLNQGFEVYNDEFETDTPAKNITSVEDLLKTKHTPTIIERSARRVVDLSIEWLDQPKEKPFFLWTHFFDPHSPYRPSLPSNDSASNPYDQEILSVDEQIGRLYDYLQKKQWLDQTLIIFLTDHGEGLGLKGEKEHGFFTYDQTLKTALIYRYPKAFQPKRVSEMVSHLDLFPTVLEMLKLPIPNYVQGKSYLDALLGGTIYSRELLIEATLPKFTHGWALVEGLRNEDWKYIQAPIEELYHLKTDPDEVENLALQSQYQPVLERMRARFQEFRKQHENTQANLEQVAIDSDHMEKMLSLGYFWGPVSNANNARESKDPKEMIEVYKLIEWARYLLTKANNMESITTLINALESILLADPQNLWSLHQLARQLLRVGRYQEAENKYHQILLQNQNQSEIYAELAHIYVLQNNYSEAEHWLQKFFKAKQNIKQEPTTSPKKEAEAQKKLAQELAQGYLIQAEIYYRQQKFTEAEEVYNLFLQKNVNTTPENKTQQSLVNFRLKEIKQKKSELKTR